MALQRRLSNYDETREHLLTYCRENNITYPFYDYPFEWVELEDQPRSPTPELPGIFPDTNVGSLNESLELTSEIADYLSEKVVVEEKDLLDIRSFKPFEYEILPPHPRVGPNVLRKFGPNSLEKVAPLLQTEVLRGEESMDIPTDMSEVLKALENDSKITVTKEQAEFLKETIFRYNQEKLIDFIHTNPGTKNYILSPPLIPYSPASSQHTFAQEDIYPHFLPAVNFDDDLPLSSQSIWDRFPSLSPGFIENFTQDINHKSSPVKVVDTETKFIFNLKLETPLTPQSLKKSVEKYEQEFQQGFRNLKVPAIPLSPESPSKDNLQAISRLENMFTNEIFTAETSLYLPVPHISQPSPTENPFPVSLFGIFIADNGLQCDEILRSMLDVANDQMKWQPFIKPSRTIDTWNEEVDGDWESFVDFSGSNNDKDHLLRRSIRVEEDELLEIGHQLVKMAAAQDKDFTDVLEIIRKRKAEAIEKGTSYGRKTSFRHSKSSQKDRIEEYMALCVRNFQDLSTEKVQEMVMILAEEHPGVPVVPVEALRPSINIIAPSPPFDSSLAVGSIILSTTTVPHCSLLTLLRQTFTKTTFFERDLTTQGSENYEGDIILSPNRCIIYFNFAQITQSLPSSASNRIIAVAEKYRQVDIIVMSSAIVRGKEVASFSGWIEKMRLKYSVRIIYADGFEESNQWTCWLCLWREVDGEINGTEFLNEEETEGQDLVIFTDFS